MNPPNELRPPALWVDEGGLLAIPHLNDPSRPEPLDPTLPDHCEVARDIFSTLKPDGSGGWIASAFGRPHAVHSFDEPLVAEMVTAPEEGEPWRIINAYGFTAPFDLESLMTDEWDRFHGRTRGIGAPFVMNPSAQDRFFDLVDRFDDTSVTYRGTQYPVRDWIPDAPAVASATFWDERYQTHTNPPWDLGQPAPALLPTLSQLKISRSRILVLGSGGGHDAAALAAAGHIVTAVDMSPLALARARNSYPESANLRYLEADIFNLPAAEKRPYDVIFEHTCYCAIPPGRRNDLVRLWHQLLVPKGTLLGIFFVMDRPQGPPFGGSEWEIRERLKPYFRPLYWTRWPASLDWRHGKELVVYAEKK